MGVEALAIAGAVGKAVGTGLDYIGQRNQAKAARAMGQYNARLAEQNAQNAEAEGAEAAHRQRIEKRRALADINAQTAASGAVMEGTPLTVLGETGKMFDVDIADMTRRAQIQAQQLRNEGALALWQGNEQSRGLKLGSIGTLFDGVGSLGQQAIGYAGLEKRGLTKSNIFGLKPTNES